MPTRRGSSTAATAGAKGYAPGNCGCRQHRKLSASERHPHFTRWERATPGPAPLAAWRAGRDGDESPRSRRGQPGGPQARHDGPCASVFRRGIGSVISGRMRWRRRGVERGHRTPRVTGLDTVSEHELPVPMRAIARPARPSVTVTVRHGAPRERGERRRTVAHRAANRLSRHTRRPRFDRRAARRIGSDVVRLCRVDRDIAPCPLDVAVAERDSCPCRVVTCACFAMACADAVPIVEAASVARVRRRAARTGATLVTEHAGKL